MTPKQQEEQHAFRQFIGRLKEDHLWLSIASRPQGEPDLRCEHSTRGPIAFEVVSLTDKRIATRQAAGPKAYSDAFSTSDPSLAIVEKKLTRTYITNAPRIELLIYTAGQIITPDDVIEATLAPLFIGPKHPFAEVWFMGEKETKSMWRGS